MYFNLRELVVATSKCIFAVSTALTQWVQETGKRNNGHINWPPNNIGPDNTDNHLLRNRLALTLRLDRDT